MSIYTLFNFYDANCFSQGDMVKLAYPRHSAGKMKAKLTVQTIDERDLWYRHPIESSISLAKDLVYIGGVFPEQYYSRNHHRAPRMPFLF